MCPFTDVKTHPPARVCTQLNATALLVVLNATEGPPPKTTSPHYRFIALSEAPALIPVVPSETPAFTPVVPSEAPAFTPVVLSEAPQARSRRTSTAVAWLAALPQLTRTGLAAVARHCSRLRATPVDPNRSGMPLPRRPERREDPPSFFSVVLREGDARPRSRRTSTQRTSIRRTSHTGRRLRAQPRITP